MRVRSLVAWAVTAPEYGRSCAIGEWCDLGERLPHGGTLGDLVRPEWFERAAPATRAKQQQPAAPAEE